LFSGCRFASGWGSPSVWDRRGSSPIWPGNSLVAVVASRTRLLRDHAVADLEIPCSLFARGYLDVAFAVSCLLRCFVWARSRRSTVRMPVIRSRVGATLPVPFPLLPVHGLSVTHVGVYSEPSSVLGLVGVATVRHMHLIAIRCSSGYRLLFQTMRQTICVGSSWRGFYG